MSENTVIAHCRTCSGYTEHVYKHSYKDAVNGTMHHRHQCSRCGSFQVIRVIRSSWIKVSPYLPVSER